MKGIFTNLNLRILLVGGVCTFLWGLVSWMSKGFPLLFCKGLDKITNHRFNERIFETCNGFYYDISNNDMPTVIFLIIFAVLFLFVCYLMRLIERNTSNQVSLGIIIFFAILFRLILIPSEPIHENDIYRYLWDGKSFSHGINPFKHAPSDLFMYEHGYQEDYYDSTRDVVFKGQVFDPYDIKRIELLKHLRDENPVSFSRIGHQQVPTIYPPVAEVLFFMSSVLHKDSLIFMKFVFFIFDLGVIFLTIMLLKHFQIAPAMCIVYAWSPLVLKEFANSGHYDPIPIFFTLLSLVLFFKKKYWSSSIVLALGVLSKFFTGILLPLLIRRLKLIHIIGFASIIILAYIPFFIWDEAGVKEVFEGLSTYNRQWSYNGSVYTILYVFLEHFFPAFMKSLLPSKVIVGLCYLIFIVYLSFKETQGDRGTLHKSFLAIATLFIINPVGDPWYYCWVIPFLCIFPYRSWLLLSALLPLSYLNFHSDIVFFDRMFLGISLMKWTIYGPFFIYLIIENIWRPNFVIEGKPQTKGDAHEEMVS